MSDIKIGKTHQGQKYGDETEEQVILAAEKLYNAGKYKLAKARIAPVFARYVRTGRSKSIPKRVLRIRFPMPLEYLKSVVNSIPDSVRRLPSEEIANRILTQFAMLLQESEGDPRAYNSRSGARGLGQIKPSTARWIAWLKLRWRNFDLYRPADNLRIMTTYINYIWISDKEKTAASYCAGPNFMKRYLRNHPQKFNPAHLAKHRKKEASEYVPIVDENFKYLNDLYGHRVLMIAKGLSTYKPAHQTNAKKKPQYKVMLASFRSFKEAKKFRIETAGPKSRIEKASVNGQVWFRVLRVFPKAEKAMEYKQWAKSNGFPTAWIPVEHLKST